MSMGQLVRAGILLLFASRAGAQRVDTVMVADSLLAVPGSSAVVGTVVGPDGKALEGVEVRLRELDRRAYTDRSGVFVLVASPRPQHTLEVRRVGYALATVPVTVAPGAVWEARLTLRESAQVLPEVQVVERYGKPARLGYTHKFDDFYRRRATHKGVFLERGDLERSGARSHVLEMLHGKAGIRVVGSGVGTRAVFPRCGRNERVAVVVDGFRVRNFPMELLDGMQIQEVEAMEVYTGVARVPGELAGENVCALVALWTRVQ